MEKRIKVLIASGKVEESISEFLSFAEMNNEKDLQGNLIHLSSRLRRVKGMYGKGVLNFNDYNIEMNKITNSLKH